MNENGLKVNDLEIFLRILFYLIFHERYYIENIYFEVFSYQDIRNLNRFNARDKSIYAKYSLSFPIRITKTILDGTNKTNIN